MARGKEWASLHGNGLDIGWKCRQVGRSRSEEEAALLES